MIIREILKNIVIAILEFEAKVFLNINKPKIVAITGSVGKTSSKDAIAEVLSSRFRVGKSTKSYNSEIGVPLSILGLENAWGSPMGWASNLITGLFRSLGVGRSVDWLVLEVGVDAPGDIEKIAKWLPTEAVVITRLPDIPVHVEAFESPMQLINEKLKLLRSLKRNGVLILNYDDRQVMKSRESIPNKVYSYGFDPGSGIWASNYSVFYEDSRPAGINFRVDSGGNSLPARLYGVLGKQYTYALLAGIALGLSQGINLVDAVQSLRNYSTPPGRMRIIEGVKNTTIIDDSYNSSPAAVELALETVDQLVGTGKKILVLGDMAELGSYSEEAHKKIGKKSAETGDMIVTVGREARFIAEGALNEGFSESNIFQFDDSQKAGKFVETRLEEGDVVLVKGSQRVRTEKVVEEVMANPENKKSLLVRQEEEWGRR